MGTGKTSSLINKMNKIDDEKYIFITPYLDEVKRIKSSCNRKFYEPTYYLPNKVHTRKFDALHTLLAEELDIVSTHALFKKANRETKELIKNGGYTLVLDEVMDVIEQLHIKKNDLDLLFSTGLLYEEDNMLLWNKEKTEWDSRYNDIRDMAINRNLIKFQDTILIWTFPSEIFKVFKEVYILTYQFDAQIQKYYYDLNDMKYENYYAHNDNGTYEIAKKDDTYSEADFKKMIKSKINILDDAKMNIIGEDKFTLSKSWYMKASDEILKQLQRRLINFFTYKTEGNSDSNMWSTFKDYQSNLKGKGFTKGFVSINARATNEFRHKTNLAYTVNRYPNTIVNNFLSSRGIKIDIDKFALSEMLQWIFRSAIRDDKEIVIYIPSKRMRELLISWLED